MFSRILLDNDNFLVTSGLLGGIKVTFKSRGTTVRANRSERARLLDVLDELKKRGFSEESKSKEFERIISDFSEALSGRGGIRWQAYFSVSTCETIVNKAINEVGDSRLVRMDDSFK